MAQSSRADTGHTGRIGLGDHACQFFLTADDLSQTLISYFKMGLEQNQACVWVTAPPYPADRALSEPAMDVVLFDRGDAKRPRRQRTLATSIQRGWWSTPLGATLLGLLLVVIILVFLALVRLRIDVVGECGQLLVSGLLLV